MHSSTSLRAPHSSTLAWKIPWTEKPGRLQSMGSLRSDTTERLHFHFSLSCIGEGNGNPLHCSCLENPREGGAWWAAVYGVAQSRTRLKRLSSSSSSSWTRWEPSAWCCTQTASSSPPGKWVRVHWTSRRVKKRENWGERNLLHELKSSSCPIFVAWNSELSRDLRLQVEAKQTD